MALSRFVPRAHRGLLGVVKSRSVFTPPGRLGNPDTSISTDPRVDVRIKSFFANQGAMMANNMEWGGSTVVDGSVEDKKAWALALVEQINDPAFADALFGWYRNVEGVENTEEIIKGDDGNDIKLTIHRPEGQSGPLPCAVRLHGGFLCFHQGDHFSGSNPEAIGPFTWWRQTLAKSGLVVIGVGFRNAVEGENAAPFPAGLNDVCAALKHINANKDKYNIGKVMVTGDNGGGNLGLAAAIKLKGQGLIDGCFHQGPYIYGPHYTSNPDSIQSHWECDGYIVSRKDVQSLSELYASPAESKNPLAWPYWASKEDLTGLCPQAILVEEISFFRDEGVKMALKLKEAGVPTNCRMVVGATWYATMMIEELVEMQKYTIRAIQGFAANL